jgi:hypothetical protein
MSTELSVETDYRKISHGNKPYSEVFSIRSEFGIHQRVVRQYSSVLTQFSWHPSVGSWDQTQTESVHQNRDEIGNKAREEP